MKVLIVCIRVGVETNFVLAWLSMNELGVFFFVIWNKKK